MRTEELLSLAAKFTHAAFEEDGWLSALDAFATASRSARGQLIGIGGPSTMRFNHVTDLPPGANADFETIGAGDPGVSWRVAAGQAVAPLEVAWERDYARLRGGLRTDVYDDFSDKYDIGFGCQTVLMQEEGLLVGLALLRSRSDGPSTPHARELMRTLAPHIRQAVKSAMLLDHQGPLIVAGALEAISVAAFVCDAHGNVRAVTAAAEAAMAAGAPLTVRAARLGAQNPADQPAIDQALGRAARLGQASTIAAGPAGRRAAVGFLPLPRGGHGVNFAPAALAVLRTGRQRRVSRDLLCALYGLTASEAAVALAFAAGKRRESIARERGVRLETVRSQMKAIFQKLGVNREAQLVARLAALAEV